MQAIVSNTSWKKTLGFNKYVYHLLIKAGKAIFEIICKQYLIITKKLCVISLSF